MKLYKSGSALKNEDTNETVAAFVNPDDADYFLAAITDRIKNFERIEKLQERCADVVLERDRYKEALNLISLYYDPTKIDAQDMRQIAWKAVNLEDVA